MFPGVDQLQIGLRDSRGGVSGSYLTREERGRGFPEYRAPDGEPCGGRAGGARREPAIDRRQVRRLAENDLPARRVGGNSDVDRPGALRRERALNLPELRRQATPVCLGDERSEHRWTAGRLELILRLVPACDQHFEDERLA